MIWLLACATTCPEDPGAARDACWHERSTELGADAARVAIAGIDDPIVKTAAVYGWIQTHGDGAERAQVLALCELLDGEDRTICARRQEAAHLR